MAKSGLFQIGDIAELFQLSVLYDIIDLASVLPIEWPFGKEGLLLPAELGQRFKYGFKLLGAAAGPYHR